MITLQTTVQEELPKARLFGTVPRHNPKERVVMVRFHGDGSLLGSLSASRLIDLYHVLPPASKEVAQKVAKRKRRLNKKQKTDTTTTNDDDIVVETSVLPTDEFK